MGQKQVSIDLKGYSLSSTVPFFIRRQFYVSFIVELYNSLFE